MTNECVFVRKMDVRCCEPDLTPSVFGREINVNEGDKHGSGS